jgi:hypothetical protein
VKRACLVAKGAFNREYTGLAECRLGSLGVLPGNRADLWQRLATGGRKIDPVPNQWMEQQDQVAQQAKPNQSALLAEEFSSLVRYGNRVHHAGLVSRM